MIQIVDRKTHQHEIFFEDKLLCNFAKLHEAYNPHRHWLTGNLQPHYYSLTGERAATFATLRVPKIRIISGNMDFLTCLSYLFEILIGIAVLLVIAMPERFFKTQTSKKKSVGASYWGNYQYLNDHPVEETEQIEVTVHLRKVKVNAGGNKYNSGKSV
jgi:hypothetical protein